MKILSCLVFAASVSALVRVSPAPPDPQAAEEGATLTGRVKIKGEIPKRRKIPTNADPKCAAMHPGDLLSDDYAIDPAGNVQYAVLYVKEGLGEQKFTAPKTPVVVEQKGCRFEPHAMGIMAGQELLFRNQDELMHIVHVVPKNNREFGFSQAKKGEERPKVFTTKETIRLFCDVHPWMEAWILVLDHPLHATSGADGKYKLKGLPPGKYTIEAWHEKYKPVTQEIEIKGKEAKTLDFVFTDKQ
jgi:plastocyanin